MKDYATTRESGQEQEPKSYDLLPLDSPAFRCWARFLHWKSDTLYEDAMIAKTNGLVVVTRNVADLAALGVPLLNPFEFGTKS